MQVLKKLNDRAGKPNELFINYSPRQDTLTQAALGLKNQFLAVYKAVQDVSGLTPVENVRPGGPPVFTRTAKHIIAHNILWAEVCNVLDGLAEAGKIQLSAEKRDLILYLLKEELELEAGISYKTE